MQSATISGSVSLDCSHISTAPVVYQQQQEIRQLLIDWAQTNQVIDPADFFEQNWQLVVAGQPIA